MRQFIKKMKDSGALHTPAIIKAFRAIDRSDFVPTEFKDYAYEDQALPIGYGQTISQPSVVAFMLEILQPQPGEKILDVGFGSGWQTALLGEIVGETGNVTAVERLPAIFALGKKNLKRYGLKNVHLLLGDGTARIGSGECFDKIIAAASGTEIPETFKFQLKRGGKMVLPIGESIFEIKKDMKGAFSMREYPGFVFVPLIRDKLSKDL